MKISKMLCVVAVLSSAFLFSCRKEKLETITSAEDNSTAESEFTAAFDLGDDVASGDSRFKKSSSTILPSGAVLTVTDSLFTDGDPKEFFIDFGAKGSTAPFGLLCGDGRYRAGKIHFTLTGPYLTVGSVLTINIDDADQYFSGNGAEMTQITGKKVITRTQTNQFTVDVTNGKAINDKGTITWQANRTITKITDAGPGLVGDVFEIIGTASGTNRNGEAFTVDITVPLKKKIQIGCANTFVKGKLTLKNTDTSKEINVDYDPFNDEACDKTAQATINGKKFTYTVR
jgi:hypothetical protein